MDRFNGLHLLVADDNKLNSQTLKQLLELSGATVVIAENGREALEWLRNSEKQFHLILMDIHMPELDGLETTRLIRQQKAFSNIPIIAVTADRSPKDQWQCFQAGMDAHIAKPIDFDKLCSSISNTLDNLYFPTESPAKPTNDVGDVESKQEILRRFANNSELVKQMISLYKQEFQKLVSEFDVIQSHHKLREILHALNGLAATIGANGVVRCVETLSDLVRSNIIYQAIFNQAKDNLVETQQRSLQQLEKLFDVNDALEQTMEIQSELQCLSSRQRHSLLKLLQQNDLSVISQIEKVKNNNPENKFVLKLSEFVHHLKFDQAITLISKSYVDHSDLARNNSAK